LSRATSGLESNQGKEGGDELVKPVMQRNLNVGQGRTLVELAQARAGGRPLSMDVGKPSHGVKLAADQTERDLPPVPIWDPEKDEMPSPFLVRGAKVIRNLR
jgi:NIMA (never in mitosis gene a)-related kinase